MSLFAAHRQIADLIDDYQLVGIDGAMHDRAVAALALRRFQQRPAPQFPRVEKESGLKLRPLRCR